MNCPHCGHDVALDAKACPACGKLEPAKGAGEAAAAIGLLFIAAVIYISPAILINYLFGRFEGNRIDASLGDLLSWAYSTIFWAGILILIAQKRTRGRTTPSVWIGFVISLVFLAPALVVNYLNGHSGEDLLLTTTRDKLSWLMSAIIWAVAIGFVYAKWPALFRQDGRPSVTTEPIRAPERPMTTQIAERPSSPDGCYRLQYRSQPTEPWRFVAGRPASYPTLVSANVALRQKQASSVENEYRVVSMDSSGFIEPT